jgi:hypothetical protein
MEKNCRHFKNLKFENECLDCSMEFIMDKNQLSIRKLRKLGNLREVVLQSKHFRIYFE